MTIHRTRQGKTPSGGPGAGRSVVKIGDWYVEYSGTEPTQGVLDAHLNPQPEWWQKRKALYHSRTVAAKGIPEATPQDAIGFWIDAFAGWAEQEIVAGRLQSTPEIDALLAIRSGVKTDVPKP